MEFECDLFGRMPDGSMNWRGFARGQQKMRTRLSKLAIQTHERMLRNPCPDT